MATITKTCRVCGKEYETCHTLKPSTNIYRWQDVACSPECGAEYFAQIEASRNNNVAIPTSHIIKNESEREDEIDDVEIDIDDDEEDDELDYEDDEDMM